MRTETTTRTLYKYDELPTDKAKEYAREWYAQGMLDYNWYEYIYEDAKTIGMRIMGFNIYRGTIEGDMLESVNEVCKSIIQNHGKSCDTYKLAKTMDLRKHNDDEETVREFKHALLEEYLSMLRKEVEYIESTENTEENIRNNEYEFTEEGRIA